MQKYVFVPARPFRRTRESPRPRGPSHQNPDQTSCRLPALRR